MTLYRRSQWRPPTSSRPDIAPTLDAEDLFDAQKSAIATYADSLGVQLKGEVLDHLAGNAVARQLTPPEVRQIVREVWNAQKIS